MSELNKKLFFYTLTHSEMFSKNVKMATGLNTFFGRNQPFGWFWRFGAAHVVFSINSELVFSARHDVAGRESIVEDSISNSVPGSFDRVTLSHQVVQPVISFLIRRRGPWNGHGARHIFIQLHGTRWLRLIWRENEKSFSTRSQVDTVKEQRAAVYASHLWLEFQRWMFLGLQCFW